MMESTEGFLTQDQFLFFTNSDVSTDYDTAIDSAISVNTSRASSTPPANDVSPSVEEASSSSSGGSERRILAAKPVPKQGPSTQFANVRHLAIGYEPYPLEIPGRYPDMRLSQRTRKGHRKSRQGCYNCKKRKIKVVKF